MDSAYWSVLRKNEILNVFFIKTPLIEELLRRIIKSFEF